MSETVVNSFTAMALSPDTLAILEQRSYTNPTPIQALVIPQLLENTQDIIAQAQTGTGKTAAYALPIIELLSPDTHQKNPRALILSPTRELAMQIAREVELFIGQRQLNTVNVYGGQSIELQLKALKSGADIVVGTPGRIIDLMERGALKLHNIQFAVLDEADEMLDMGFVEDIEKILDAAPEDKRMLMFSATIPPEAKKIAEQFMQQPVCIKAPAPPSGTIENLTEQWACEVRREDKFNALKRILNAEGKIYAMIFCRTRLDVDELTMNLQKNKFSAEALHGELTQNQRTRVIEQFKNRRFDILVATDVAARGIDVNDLSHVINYALPMNSDIYTHRIGRTGRAGKKGVAISIFSPSEGGKFAMLKKATRGALQLRPLPDAKAIIATKKKRFQAELEKMLPQIHPAYHQLAEELSEVFDPFELLAALLDMRFHKELLPENYPALSKGKREHERSARPRNKNSMPVQHNRKQHVDSPADAPDTAKQENTRKKNNKNAFNSPGKRQHSPAESDHKPAVPRRKLRDWAMTLTEDLPEKPRRKNKKHRG